MIRWITEDLGTAAYGALPDDIDAIIVDVRDLVDKAGNPPALVREKIEEALAQRRLGRKVVVCCDYGMSRSNAIAAGVLSLECGISVADAARRVIVATGEKEIKVEMLDAVRRALGVDRKRPSADRRRVLLTGGSGFIGRSLGSSLTEMAQVFAPGRQEVDLVGDAVALDLYVNEHAIDCVVHLANPRVYTSNQALGQIMAMMRNVLDVCRNNGLKLFYLSGWEVFSGYRSQSLLADEALPLRAKGPYGEAKLLSEVMIEQFQRNFGLRRCIIRSGPVLGSGSDRPRFIHTFWEKAIRHETIYTHRYLNGPPALDMIALDDLVEAMRLLIKADADGVYHVGTGRATSTFEVARMVADMAGSSSEIRCRDVEEYTANIAMDASRLASGFGWRARQGLREMLVKMLDIPMQQMKGESE